LRHSFYSPSLTYGPLWAFVARGVRQEVLHDCENENNRPITFAFL